ncbi:ABC transporter substrate-binding protein [Thermoleophilia bacterium SCSIO 60948]|nr:ABC transporter substrate-binding protein [Thermoleophilia bacterium SCSIO 60948]
MKATSRYKPVAFATMLFAAMSMLAACSATEGASGASEGRVYLSAPLSGPDAVAGRDIADGAKLALDQAEGEAAGVEISLEVMDSAAKSESGWNAAVVGDNARAAIQDAGGLAYIGDFTSGATRTSLPLTNSAGMLQVSPSASAMDLVIEPGTLSDPNEDYAVGGQRTFARVVPSDDFQAEAAAEIAERSGLNRIVVVTDGSEYGDVMADAFTERARELGVGVGAGGGDPLEQRRSGQQVAPGTDLGTYLAVESEGFEKNSTVPSGEEIWPDALLGPGDGRLAPVDGDEIGALRGIPRAVAGAQLPEQLPVSGEAFVERFEDIYGREPGRFAAYGYESMALVLDAIERGASDRGVRREDIVDEAFLTQDRDSVLGTYSIDDTGETTLEGVGVALSIPLGFAGSPGRPLGEVGSLRFLEERLGGD